MKQYRSRVIFVCVVAMFFVAQQVQAARLFFQPQEQVVGTENTFSIAVMLDAETPVNTVSVSVHVPESLTPIDTYDGNSLLNFWIDRPIFDEQTRELRFSGIIPGGFSGIGPLLVAEFEIVEGTQALLDFNLDATIVYQHSPDGIADSVIAESIALPIIPGKENIGVELPDSTAPEQFTPMIVQDIHLLQNEWTVLFATQDKGSGLSHFEIVEKRGNETDQYDKLDWKQAKSPYALSDQERKSYIYVKAVDKEGNERVVVLSPLLEPHWYEKSNSWGILAVVIVSIGFIVVVLKRRYVSH